VQKFDDVTRFLSGSSKAEIGKKKPSSSIFSNFQKKYSSNKFSDPMFPFSIQFCIRIAIHFTFRCFLGQKGIEIPFLSESKKMGENEGKLKIIHSQTIFDTSNTDIRDHPD